MSDINSMMFLNTITLTYITVYSLSQEKDCASLYEMKTYVEPNEIEPSLVCIHHYFLSALAVCYNLQFPLIYIDIHHCVCLSALASEHC